MVALRFTLLILSVYSVYNRVRMINSFHLEIKAPLSSLGLLQGAGLLLQAWGMGLKRPFSKSQEDGSAQCPAEKLMESAISRDYGDAVRTLTLPLISPGLTTTWGPQLPQSIGVEGSLDHSIPVTSLSTAIRKPREVPMQPGSASNRPRPERNCPPVNLRSPPFPGCIFH